MKILITGANGFLARNLIKLILENTEHNVVALTSKCKEVLRQWQEYEKRVFVFSNLELQEVKWQEIDVLINCAFPRNLQGIQMANGLKYISDVLMSAVAGGVKSVINISSQSVYSQKRKKAANEKTPLDLETKYAVGKYATELLTNSICHNIRYTNIRLASLIGPEFEQRLVNKFIKQVMEGNNLNIVGTEQYFGFMDVNDASNAILKIVEDNGEWDEVYNLGVRETCSIVVLAEKVKDIVGNNILINIQESETCLNSDLDSSVFYERFGFIPQITIEQSICNIFGFLKEKGSRN